MILETPTKDMSGTIHPVELDDNLLLSPELAFKSAFKSAKEKKRNFDIFRKHINIAQVAAYDGSLVDLESTEQVPITPVEKRKAKTKSPVPVSFTSKPEDKKKTRTNRSSFRSLCKLISDVCVILKKSSWTLCIKQLATGLPYVYVGVAVAFACELFANSPKYNLPLLLILLAGTSYESFPSKTIRPHIVIFMLTFASCVLDLQTLIIKPVPIALRVMVAYVMFSKIVALYRFIRRGKGTERARKFLYRRFRVFGLTTIVPRRVMRDIRNRILALEWIHIIAAGILGGMFALSITTFGFNFSNVNESSPVGISLALFLLGKLVTTIIVFFAILSDTDTTLCLGYFGCLGFCMKQVKAYTRRKREEYGGWPLAYAFNKTRFYVVVFLKCCDWGWGVVGWIIIASFLGKDFRQLPDPAKIAIFAITLLLAVTDIWSPLLFWNALWLIKEHKKMVEEDEDVGDSDDSELDDFGVRTPLTSPKAGNNRPSTAKSNRSKKAKNSIEESDSSDDDSDSEDNDGQRSVTKSPLSQSRINRNLSPTFAAGTDAADGSFDDIHLSFQDDKSDKDADLLAQYKKGAGLTPDANEFSIIIDPYAIVTPEEFSDMWSALSVAGEFSCDVKPLKSQEISPGPFNDGFEYPRVVEHFREMGFFVVAAGEVPGSSTNEAGRGGSSLEQFKMFAYAVGYSSNINLVIPIYFLLELKMNKVFEKQNGALATVSMSCVNKCTKKEYTASFVEEMNLGCIFELVFDTADSFQGSNCSPDIKEEVVQL